jgi:Mn-dependent DtxR family transcriptional regulator
MKSKEAKFYTVRGYELLEKDRNRLTPSMEDYLEMAYRLSKGRNYTRISDLAAALNVQPPSVTSMIKKLAELGMVNYEKYSIVILTDKGLNLGNYLLHRHEIIERFLRVVGSENILQETEKLEHSLGPKTIQGLNLLINLIENNEQILNGLSEKDN